MRAFRLRNDDYVLRGLVMTRLGRRGKNMDIAAHHTRRRPLLQGTGEVFSVLVLKYRQLIIVEDYVCALYLIVYKNLSVFSRINSCDGRPKHAYSHIFVNSIGG